jgi:phosphatidylinositol alpha-1,6-mannosyltransferase
MTTLLISDVFPPKTGGSGRWFWEIYRRLPRDEFIIAAGEDPRQEQFDQSHSLRLVRAPLALRAWGVRSLEGLRGYWRALRYLLRLVRSEGVNAVHCGRCIPEGLMALALKFWIGVPYVCYVHGEDVNTALDSREHTWLVKKVLQRADFLIANSKATQRLLQEQWALPAERIRLLHPGVDTTHFVPSGRDPAARKRLGWMNRTVVLTVGRLQKRKGHDQMILALPEVRRAIPNVLYAIVGEGEERPFLEDLVAREQLGGHVQFLGELADEGLVRCYQQCDIFVLPNRQVGRDIEGFGMVLLEAQACGKPVIAGASGGTAETMRIPETGQVVCCDGPGKLAALLSELLADPDRLARMGAAGRQWVVEHFDWKALADQAKRLFQRARRVCESDHSAQTLGKDLQPESVFGQALSTSLE